MNRESTTQRGGSRLHTRPRSARVGSDSVRCMPGADDVGLKSLFPVLLRPGKWWINILNLWCGSACEGGSDHDPSPIGS